MSYLKNYLSGDAFWMKDSIRLIKDFEVEAYVVDGIVRWKSNNHIPPKDILELWKFVGKEFDYDLSIKIQGIRI